MSILPSGGVDMLFVRYIKSYKVRDLKIKLVILYILNVIDIIFNLLSIDVNKFFYDGAFIQVVKDINLPTMLIKAGFTLIILLILCINLRSYGDKYLFHSNIIIMFSMISYIFINVANIITEVVK